MKILNIPVHNYWTELQLEFKKKSDQYIIPFFLFFCEQQKK